MVLIGLLGAGETQGDPLDRVTGTEGWSSGKAESISSEWKDWYRCRISWRKAARELRIQRLKSRRLAQMLKRTPEGPDLSDVRQVIRSSRLTPASPAASLPPGSRRSGDRSTGPRTPDPPAWIKVPVERLDVDGQAIDEEGDQVLKRLKKRKRSE
jgi:hypothetical protein